MARISRRAVVATGISLTAVGSAAYGFMPYRDDYEEAAAAQRKLLAVNPEQRELMRMATLAPNGHNTQPWKFRLGEQQISILPDLTRRTEIVDPDDHHLYISLGCAAENLVVAAAATGQATEVAIAGSETPRIDISLSAAEPAPCALYEAIPIRQSTRTLYDGQQISAQDMTLLEQAAREDGVSVLFFTDAADLAAITDFVVAGNSAQMDDPAFVRELRNWLRFSYATATRTGDGLFGACSGNPVGPDWIGERLFGMFFTKEAETRKYTDQIRSSSGIAVFVGDRDDPEHWINVGRSFERFALQATALGIRNAHVNQPIEDPVVRPEFASWLGLPGKRPDLVIRFGRAPLMPMSLRRPVADVLA